VATNLHHHRNGRTDYLNCGQASKTAALERHA
jgi:hypothetical protein